MPTPHEKLFARYVDELAEANKEVDAWWDALLKAETARTGDRRRALQSLRPRWPVGPGTHPRIIHVIRKYFLACHALNEKLAGTKDEEEIYPHLFVGEWLMEDATRELADFVAEIPYWPIGFDDDEDWL